MKELNLKDLIKFKKLPFNIYNEKGQILMYTGDLLTSGKIMELQTANTLIYDENYEKKSQEERENPLVMKRKISQQNLEREALKNKRRQELLDIQNEAEEEKEHEKANAHDSNSIRDLRINYTSKFSQNFQIAIKEKYKEILSDIKNFDYKNAKEKIIVLTDEIDNELNNKFSEIRYLSQLKLLGEYKFCHNLNVAIISGFITKVSTQVNMESRDIILSGLLHDIGKIELNPNIADRISFYNQKERTEYEKHVVFGYKIIREEFNFGNKIARPALEHHVLIDGTGYPRGISVDNVTEMSKLISVVNYYDKLTSNRTSQHVTYNYEIGKILLSNGAKKYPVNLVYDISNKYILNDTSELSELIK